MAFNQEEGRAEFTASAAQVSFPFTFKVYVATDVKVYLTPFGQESNDANDILILTTDYSISVNGDLGGVLTLTTGASNGDSITIVRDLPINRPVEYQTNGDMLATTLNGDQNYQTYLTSDRDTVAQRHIRIPDSTQNVSVILPDVQPDSYLVWNSAGNALVNDSTIPQSVSITEGYKNDAEKAAYGDPVGTGTITKGAQQYSEESSVSASEAATSAVEAAAIVPTSVRKDSDTGAAYIPSGTTAERPVAPANGYLRYNTDLGSMEAYTAGAWGSVGGGATGGAGNAVFYENDQTVTVDYTVTTGQNAMSAGPVTVANGVTVTVPTGSRWTVV